MSDSIDPTDDVALTELDFREARNLTDSIKIHVEKAWLLIEEAYVGRAWVALGYDSWDVYCIKEFGTARLRIPREERPEMVKSLRDAGLSIRAIASATGASVNTVQSDLQVSQTDTPADSVDEDELTEAALAAGEPTAFNKLVPIEQDAGDVGERGPGNRRWSGKPIIGRDGKTYRPKPPPPQQESKRRRQPITDEFRALSLKLMQIGRRIDRLSADDRIARYRGKLNVNRNDLIRFRDALNGLIDQLDGDDE